MGLIAWSLAVGAAMAYAQQVLLSFKLRRHKALLALTPLLMPLFLYLPCLPSSSHIRTILCISLLWIAPCKLVLIALDAPLDPLPWISSGFSRFCVSTLLPVRIASPSPPPPSSSSSSHLFFLKLLLLIAILNIYPLFPFLPSPFLYLLYCIHFYLGLELAFGAVASMVERLFSVTLCAQFDKPYLAESLSDFWGRRWNLTVHSLLKTTVYRPVLLHVAMPGKGRAGAVARAVATAATFAMSGVMHEVIYMYVSKRGATGEMATFFLVHGAATIAEGAMSRQYLQAMPRSLRHILTLSFVYITASFFFMMPLRRTGIDTDAIAEYHRVQSACVSFIARARH